MAYELQVTFLLGCVIMSSSLLSACSSRSPNSEHPYLFLFQLSKIALSVKIHGVHLFPWITEDVGITAASSNLKELGG